MVNNILQILAVICFVILAGFFAGSETGMYRLSRLRLRLGVEKKKMRYRLLASSMHDSPGFLLSMLVGTNLAHYLATSIVTMMLLTAVHSEHSAELFATGIVAPTLFIFAELIPKNIFFYRADYLMPFCAPLLYVFHKLLTLSLVVPALKGFSRIFATLVGTPTFAKTVTSDVREHHIKSIVRETKEEGFLSPVQVDMMNRLIRIPEMQLRAVMTPISKVQMVPTNCDKALLLKKLKQHAFTRLLVYQGSAANIVGFINVYETLTAPVEFTDLADFIKPIRNLPAGATVSQAIDVMQNENQKMALVTRTAAAKPRPIGIVTMKDLVEELLGELTEW